MDSLLKDFRYAVRGLLRAPAFTIPLVLTLALGLGANTTVFTVLSAVLLRPLGYERPDELVRLFELLPRAGADGAAVQGTASVPNLRDWQREQKSFTGLAGYAPLSLNLQSGGDAERLQAIAADDGLFTLLGVAPVLGRALQSGDAAADRRQVAVLSDGLWRRRFAGDPAIVGRTLVLDHQSVTVVGVMPPVFSFPAGSSGIDLWVPLRPPADQQAARDSHWLRVVGRLRPGATLGTAQAEMDAIAARIARDFPDDQEGRGILVRPLHDTMVTWARPRLLILGAAALLVLLIACANAASLVLARAVARRRELGVRMALGAGRWRLLRQLLLEVLAVAAVGAAAGLLLARPAVAALVELAGGNLPRRMEMDFDHRIFLFVLVVTLVVAVAAALAPGLQLRSQALAGELQAGSSRTGSARGSRRLRAGLVVTQVALSAVLLAGTGLLLQTLAALLATDPGMVTEQVVTLRLAAPQPRTDPPEADPAYERVLQRVSALPGVRAAGWISQLPLREFGWNGNFTIAGMPDPASRAEAPFAEFRGVSPGYFAALGVPLLQGRFLRPADNDREAPAVLVNHALVAKYLRGLDAVGRLIVIDDRRVPIAGVVGDVRQQSLDAPPVPEIYFPYQLRTSASLNLVVRSDLPPEATLAMLRAAVREVAPDLPPFDASTMDEVVTSSLADRKLVLTLLAAFAAVALLLCAAGLYGLLAYLVAQSRREIGIRMALGAARRAVLRLVLGQGARLLAIGLVIGLLLAIAGGRLLGGLLYGVTPADPWTLLAVTLVLTVVSLLALWVPVRRAMRVDPAHVLREDG